jgi:hypothetical protein
MDQNIGRTDLLPSTVPTLALALMAVGGLALWAILHRVLQRRRDSMPVWLRFAILAPTGSVAMWCLLQYAARPLFLSGAWPLWVAATVTGVVVEGVSLLYERECEAVRPSVARALVLMRLLAIGITIFILLQPVLVKNRERPIRRRVAVLVDDSASMLRPDKQWSLPETLDMAQALGDVKASERPLRESLAAGEALKAKIAYWRQLTAAVEGAPQTNDLRTVVDEGRKWVGVQSEAVAALLPAAANDRYRGERDLLDRMARHLRDSLAPALGEIEKALADGKRDLQAPLAAVGDAVEQLVAALPGAADAADTLLWDGFPRERQERIRALVDVPRATLARKVLVGAEGQGEPALLSRLRSRYDVDLFTFGREALRVVDASAYATSAVPSAAAGVAPAVTNSAAAAFRAVTDITHSLEDVMGSIPSEELAGVLLLSDGRHTGESGVEAVARRLGQARVPVSTVVIGGTRPPLDVALANARAPESVFLGDRVRVVATVAATGAKGRATRLRLLLGDELIAEEQLPIDSDDWVREVRLSDTPKEQGVRRYRIVADVIEGEELSDNNAWDLDVSVTDDRTNVLLVDNRPRWEFRYLRNLFYGRDKSVHLQYYLVTPDTISGQNARKLPPASASREFGDAEAGALPEGRDEWRKFDVIILGDLGDDLLTPDVVENIRYCVEERGALLVVIAGPEKMPYAVRGEAFRRLVPITYEPGDADRRQPPEEAFRVKLTPAGRGHDVLRQSASVSENEQIWAELPDFHWRVPVGGVKPGAEVLAYAAALDDVEGQAVQRVVAEMSGNPEEAIRQLAEVRQQQARNALFVAQSVGQGKVLMLTTDRTWRLRYRVGDTLHHRFWGQVTRWGTGEKLRAGNAFVRLGTDQLSYTPSEPIRVLARLSDSSFAPLTDARVEAVLSLDGRELKRVMLEYRKDSNGVYEGVVDPLADAAVYTLALRSPDAQQKLGADFPEKIETRFVVVTARRPAEFVNITADWRTPQIIAQLSGGQAIRPTGAAALWDAFGEGSRVLTERVETQLWDSWWLFVLIVLLLTAEWLLRKKGGLA